MRQILTTWCLAAVVAAGAGIDYGTLYMPAYFVSDGTHAVGQFGSTGGAFSLFANPFSSSHFMPGGGELGLQYAR
jgi:hypothetical protein